MQMKYPKCQACPNRCDCCGSTSAHTCNNCYSGHDYVFQPKDYISFCPIDGKEIAVVHNDHEHKSEPIFKSCNNCYYSIAGRPCQPKCNCDNLIGWKRKQGG